MDFNHIESDGVTPNSVRALNDFLGLVEITPFKRKLRKLLFYYLINEHEEPDTAFLSFLEDMEFAMDFLDALEDEQNLKT